MSCSACCEVVVSSIYKKGLRKFWREVTVRLAQWVPRASDSDASNDVVYRGLPLALPLPPTRSLWKLSCSGNLEPCVKSSPTENREIRETENHEPET